MQRYDGYPDERNNMRIIKSNNVMKVPLRKYPKHTQRSRKHLPAEGVEGILHVLKGV